MKTPLAVVSVFCGLFACGPVEAPDEFDAAQDSESQEIQNGKIDNRRPYVVAIGAVYDSKDAVPTCSGTLISTRTVLTAGHCVSLDGSDFVVFGKSVNSPQAKRIRVVKSIMHPFFQYRPGATLTHDLALMLLEEDAPVSPSPLLRQTLENTSQWLRQATIVGFGYSNSGLGTRRYANLPIAVVGPGSVSPDIAPKGRIDESMVFSSDPNWQKGTCRGDSGGPLVISVGGVEYQAGLTSFSPPYCSTPRGTVSARTDGPAIDEFIQSAIEELEPNNPCRNDGVCTANCVRGNFVADPDCASKHCGADGVCSPACVSDPDCTEAAKSTCRQDGVCNGSCSNPDPDCESVMGKTFDSGRPVTGAAMTTASFRHVQKAEWSSSLGAPFCARNSQACDSGKLLKGRGSTEKNASNTFKKCDEDRSLNASNSIERIMVHSTWPDRNDLKSMNDVTVWIRTENPTNVGLRLIGGGVRKDGTIAFSLPFVKTVKDKGLTRFEFRDLTTSMSSDMGRYLLRVELFDRSAASIVGECWTGGLFDRDDLIYDTKQ